MSQWVMLLIKSKENMEVLLKDISDVFQCTIEESPYPEDEDTYIFSKETLGFWGEIAYIDENFSKSYDDFYNFRIYITAMGVQDANPIRRNEEHIERGKSAFNILKAFGKYPLLLIVDHGRQIDEFLPKGYK
jgi:hypothetical protein